MNPSPLGFSLLSHPLSLWWTRGFNKATAWWAWESGQFQADGVELLGKCQVVGTAEHSGSWKRPGPLAQEGRGR